MHNSPKQNWKASYDLATFYMHLNGPLNSSSTASDLFTVWQSVVAGMRNLAKGATENTKTRTQINIISKGRITTDIQYRQETKETWITDH